MLPIAYLLDMAIFCICCCAEMLVLTIDVQATLGQMMDGSLGTERCVEGRVLGMIDYDTQTPR